MIQKYLIQEGYLTLVIFILFHLVWMSQKHRLSKKCFKSKINFPPFRKWTWNKPPDNYRSIFYVDICFGVIFFFMALVIINAPGYAIMLGYLSLICWIIALRLFFRVRKLEKNKGVKY